MKRKIPFHRPSISVDEINAVVETLENRWTTMGPRTVEFEKLFTQYIGSTHSVSVNSGTAALHCALTVLGIGEKDEVIIPANTFVATAEVVEYCRARLIMVDVERDTHCIDCGRIAEKITPRTKAIIPVHFAGHPCDMNPLMELSQQNSISVIEDAAHALPSWYAGRRVGTFGDMACFSFYATKTLAVGEGGMIATESDAWADRLRTLRLHGMSHDAWERYIEGASWKYDVAELGYKYNTTDINAALGIVQLGRVEDMQRARARIAQRYNDAFKEEESLIPYIVRSDNISSWHLYPLKLELEALKIGRDRFIDELNARGIHVSVHFIPVYRFTYYKERGYRAEEFNNCEWIYEREISLPIFPDMTDEDVGYVIEKVLEICREHKR